MKNKIVEIRNLIAENKMDIALNKLEWLSDNNAKKYRNTIVILKRRFIDLEDKELKGIIKKDDKEIEINKIANAILEIIDNIESHPKADRYKKRVSREKVIMLAGAGLSDYLGYDIIVNLPVLINEKIKEKTNERYSEAASWVKEIWEQAIPAGTVENVINQLNLYYDNTLYYEKSDILKKKLPLKGEGEITNAKKTWKLALELCYDILYEKYNQECFKYCENTNKFVEQVKNLCSTNSDNNLYIFTTNYDCLFQAMTYVDVIVNQINIFSRINSKGAFDGERWYKHKKGKVSLAKKDELNLPSVFVERLHGCVSWQRDSSVKYGMREVSGNHKKLMGLKLTSNQLGEHIAFSSAFNHFRDRLDLCQKLVVWGHSFRDIEVLIEIVRTHDKNEYKIEFIDKVKFKGRLEENIRKTLSGKLEQRFADNISLKRSKYQL